MTIDIRDFSEAMPEASDLLAITEKARIQEVYFSNTNAS